MAEATILSTGPRFPPGTALEAYPRDRWNVGQYPAGAPPGDPIATGTAGSSPTFTGLSEGGKYVAYALVNGQHRYVNFAVAGSPQGEVAEADQEVSVVSDTFTVSGTLLACPPGKRIRVYKVFAVADQDATKTPLTTISFSGGDTIASGYAISQRQQKTGATDQPLIVTLDESGGEVAVTVNYEVIDT